MNCDNVEELPVSSHIGGIAGAVWKSRLSDIELDAFEINPDAKCRSTDENLSVSTIGLQVGGLAGLVYDSEVSKSSVRRFIFNSNNTQCSEIGGLIGASRNNQISSVIIGPNRVTKSGKIAYVSQCSRDYTSSPVSYSVELSCSRNMGGLIGTSLEGDYMNNVIVNCVRMNGLEDSENFMGGLIGVSNDSVISNVFLDGIALSGVKTIGGLIGRSDDVSINNAYVNATLSATDSHAAGLMAVARKSTRIVDSKAISSISSPYDNAGLIASVSDNLSVDNMIVRSVIDVEGRLADGTGTSGFVNNFSSKARHDVSYVQSYVHIRSDADSVDSVLSHSDGFVLDYGSSSVDVLGSVVMYNVSPRLDNSSQPQSSLKTAGLQSVNASKDLDTDDVYLRCCIIDSDKCEYFNTQPNGREWTCSPLFYKFVCSLNDLYLAMGCTDKTSCSKLSTVLTDVSNGIFSTFSLKVPAVPYSNEPSCYKTGLSCSGNSLFAIIDTKTVSSQYSVMPLCLDGTTPTCGISKTPTCSDRSQPHCYKIMKPSFCTDLGTLSSI